MKRDSTNSWELRRRSLATATDRALASWSGLNEARSLPSAAAAATADSYFSESKRDESN